MEFSPQPEPVERVADFERFAVQASPVLVRSAFLLTGDWGHAEDLLQTTLLRVARRWPEIDRSPEAYAHGVLVNLYRDRHRGLTRRVVEVLQPDLPERPGRDSAEQSVDRAEMVWAVRGLPYRQREVVVLRFFLDLSVADTARLLGTSEGTVKSHTDRALKGLRELLADQREPSAAVKEVPDAH
jgi:RNA polymerase sigma-70 factor (sigma-E family)